MKRRSALEALSVMDSHEDADFLRVNRLAAALFTVPSSAIAVVDAKRAWLVSAFGTDLKEVPVKNSFAAHAIAAPGTALLVLDASKDKRFADSVLVKGAPAIRFYAGTPIIVHGQRIGALQVFSPEPRPQPAPGILDQLHDLAATAGALFELKHEARVRERTAAELIREEWRHALTLEAGMVGSWVWDMGTDTVVANEILRRMFGLGSSGPIRSREIFSAMDQRDRPVVDAALNATFDTGVDYASEFRIASTGRWLVGRGRVYQRDAAGKPLVMMGVNIDVTEAREAADHTRLLLRELNHRVKNTLAVIQSLARQTMRQHPDPQRFIEAFSGRLRALSDAHALLSDRDWTGIGLIEQIESRVRHHALDGKQVVLEGEEVQLPPDHALALGLVLHELASNAAQFGALSVLEGRLRISWSIVEGTPRRLELVWRESKGPKIQPPPETGFGLRLIERGLDKIVDSVVDLRFPPGGVEARISLPLG